jgi:hypothetical protein
MPRYNRLALVIPDSGSLKVTDTSISAPWATVLAVLLATTGFVVSTITVKSPVLVAENALVVTDMRPVVVPLGTCVVMLVDVEAVTVAAVPLKLTVLPAGVVLKPAPWMVIVAPTIALAGLKEFIIGGAIKSVVLVTDDSALVVTLIGPEDTPAGTTAVMVVEVEAVIVAGLPLKVTALLAGMVLKPSPVMITVVPAVPLAGEKELIARGPVTVKGEALKLSRKLTVTDIRFVAAPTGTIAVILVSVDAVTVANILLNLTSLSVGVGLKPVPVMVTGSYMGPALGLNELTVGGRRTVKS